MPKNSIKTTMLAYFAAFCGILIAVLWITQVVCFEDFYKSIKVCQVRRSAVKIEKNIDSADLDGIIRDISMNEDVCVDILTDEGVSLSSAHSSRECFIHRIPAGAAAGLIESTLESDDAIFGYYDRSSFALEFGGKWKDGFMPPMPEKSSQSLLYSKAAQSSRGTLIIVISSAIAPVDATVAATRTQLMIITAGILILGVILALLISQKVSQPIININDAAKRLKEGKYDVIFEGRGYKEIEELSDTLTAAAKELDKVESLRKELIANISHDLRTPLTLISGYGELMRDLPGENNSENAQIIIDEAKRLTGLVTDMLDISKIQSGTVELKIESFSLTDMVEKVINRVSAMLKAENYEIIFEKDDNVTATGDEQRLMQAFYNLLTNAVNYTGPDKRITVSQKLNGGFVRISVSDSGEGIEKDELPYIWDRYYKSKTGHKRAKIGTGLGLSIVKSVIELHKGRCGVESVPEQGSTFWFELKI